MSYREEDIIEEGPGHWVLRVRRGRNGKPVTGYFEVLRYEATHSVVVGTYHFSNDPAKAKSMALAARAHRDGEIISSEPIDTLMS